MSDQRETAAACPKCGAELAKSQRKLTALEWDCMSQNSSEGFHQSDTCRIRELTAENAMLQAELAEAKDELKNDPGDCADVRLGFENERLAAELAEAKAEYERLRDENTRLRAALAVSKDPDGRWQSMKSAPKDGAEVLLLVESRSGISGKMLVGHWQPGGHCIEDHPAIDTGWYFWNGRMFDLASKPIAWMALPAIDAAMEKAGE